MRSGSRCPAFYGEIPPMRWGILNDDGGYFYCITYTPSSATSTTTSPSPASTPRAASPSTSSAASSSTTSPSSSKRPGPPPKKRKQRTARRTTSKEALIYRPSPQGGALARDASGIPGSAERSEAEEMFCLEFRFFCTFPRRAAPLPPLRGPLSRGCHWQPAPRAPPEEKVCSHPLNSKW